ncbi:hypothetical protein Hanom_Chr07g00603071 [Helianthus anomalus]
MNWGFIRLWRPYNFCGPMPKPHLSYPWAGPGFVNKFNLSKKKKKYITLVSLFFFYLKDKYSCLDY